MGRPSRHSVLMIRLLVFFVVVSATAVAEDNPQPGSSEASPFTVHVVQMSISSALYESESRFFEHVETLVAEAAADRAPDLIVFPEYVSAFLAVTAYSDTVLGARSFAKAAELLVSLEPSIGSVTDLFRSRSAAVGRSMDRNWGDIARTYRTTVLAGSYFAADPDSTDVRNRAVVYGPDGSRLYEQDKVYLTSFERDVLGLSGGRVDEARVFSIGELDVALTICRDTFFDVWSSRFGDADLWVDIKANGTSYTLEEAARSLSALPARLEASDVPFGVTSFLVGSFLDLYFEGRSFAVFNDEAGTLRFVEMAATSSRLEVLEARIEASGPSGF